MWFAAFSAFVLLALAMAGLTSMAATAEASDVHWSYKGDTGPEHWAELSPEFAAAVGNAQSPIDILPETVKPSKGRSVDFHYGAGGYTVLNNGHTIQMTPDDRASSHIILDGKKYYLQQFHFHVPSEHTVSGKPCDMEIHFVNRSEDGKLAVVGLFMSEGRENDLIARSWAVAPEVAGGASVKVEGAYDPSKFLPGNLENVQYQGSLTTPPTSEGVSWVLLKEHGEASRGQLDHFLKVIGENARPVQPFNCRELFGCSGSSH